MQPNLIQKERDFKGSTKTPKAKTGLFEDADFPAANSSIGGVTGGTVNIKIWRLMNQLLSPWVSIVGWARLNTLRGLLIDIWQQMAEMDMIFIVDASQRYSKCFVNFGYCLGRVKAFQSMFRDPLCQHACAMLARVLTLKGLRHPKDFRLFTVFLRLVKLVSTQPEGMEEIVFDTHS